MSHIHHILDKEGQEHHVSSRSSTPLVIYQRKKHILNSDDVSDGVSRAQGAPISSSPPRLIFFRSVEWRERERAKFQEPSVPDALSHSQRTPIFLLFFKPNISNRAEGESPFRIAVMCPTVWRVRKQPRSLSRV